MFGFEWYFYLHLVSWTFYQIHVTGLKFNKDFFEYRKYFIRQSGDRNLIFISHIWNLISHGESCDLLRKIIAIRLYIFSCFRNSTDTIVSNTQKNVNIYDIILFEGLSVQNTVIRNYYALLFLLVPGHAIQKNLLVRQVLCTSRTSQA
jgi:hypothetical protein